MYNRKLNDSELKTVSGGIGFSGDSTGPHVHYESANEAIDIFNSNKGLSPNGIATESVRATIEEKLRPY